MIVGGHAVAFHGHPRATAAIDIWVATDEANLPKVRASLRQFGLPAGAVPATVFAPGKEVLRIGMPPCRIEIMKLISGVEFEQCYQRAITARIDGIEVRLISRDDLLMNKRSAGRLKDQADVAALQPRQS